MRSNGPLPISFTIITPRDYWISPRMITGGRKMKNFRPAKQRIAVSPGESVRIIWELQGLSQNQLAERTGIAHDLAPVP